MKGSQKYGVGRGCGVSDLSVSCCSLGFLSNGGVCIPSSGVTARPVSVILLELGTLAMCVATAVTKGQY